MKKNVPKYRILIVEEKSGRTIMGNRFYDSMTKAKTVELFLKRITKYPKGIKFYIIKKDYEKNFRQSYRPHKRTVAISKYKAE